MSNLFWFSEEQFGKRPVLLSITHKLRRESVLVRPVAVYRISCPGAETARVAFARFRNHGMD